MPPTIQHEAFSFGGRVSPVAGVYVTPEAGESSSNLQYRLREVGQPWSEAFLKDGLRSYTSDLGSDSAYFFEYLPPAQDHRVQFRHGTGNWSNGVTFSVGEGTFIETANAGRLMLSADFGLDGKFNHVDSHLALRLRPSIPLTAIRGDPVTSLIPRVRPGILTAALDTADEQLKPWIVGSPLRGLNLQAVRIILHVDGAPQWGGYAQTITAINEYTVKLTARGAFGKLFDRLEGLPLFTGPVWDRYQELIGAASGPQVWTSTPLKAAYSHTQNISNHIVPEGQTRLTALEHLTLSWGDHLLEDQYGDVVPVPFTEVVSRRNAIPHSPACISEEYTVVPDSNFDVVQAPVEILVSATAEVYRQTIRDPVPPGDTVIAVVSSPQPVVEWGPIVAVPGLSASYGIRYSKLAEVKLSNSGLQDIEIGELSITADVVSSRDTYIVARPKSSAISSIERLLSIRNKTLPIWTNDPQRAASLAEQWLAAQQLTDLTSIYWDGPPYPELLEAVQGVNTSWVARLEYSLDRNVWTTKAFTLPIPITGNEVIILNVGPGLGTGILGA